MVSRLMAGLPAGLCTRMRLARFGLGDVSGIWRQVLTRLPAGDLGNATAPATALPASLPAVPPAGSECLLCCAAPWTSRRPHGQGPQPAGPNWQPRLLPAQQPGHCCGIRGECPSACRQADAPHLTCACHRAACAAAAHRQAGRRLALPRQLYNPARSAVAESSASSIHLRVACSTAGVDSCFQRVVAPLLAAGIKRVALLDFDVHHGECSLCGCIQHVECAPLQACLLQNSFHELGLHRAGCCL